MVSLLPSGKPYHTSVTPASHLSALVSHAHHKMLVVARCAKTTRVERRVRRCEHPHGFAQTRKLLGFLQGTCATGEDGATELTLGLEWSHRIIILEAFRWRNAR